MQMLIKSPEQRIKPEDALAHKYFNFNGLNKKQIPKKVNLGQTITQGNQNSKQSASLSQFMQNNSAFKISPNRLVPTGVAATS